MLPLHLCSFFTATFRLSNNPAYRHTGPAAARIKNMLLCYAFPFFPRPSTSSSSPTVNIGYGDGCNTNCWNVESKHTWHWNRHQNSIRLCFVRLSPSYIPILAPCNLRSKGTLAQGKLSKYKSISPRGRNTSLRLASFFLFLSFFKRLMFLGVVVGRCVCVFFPIYFPFFKTPFPAFCCAACEPVHNPLWRICVIGLRNIR